MTESKNFNQNIITGMINEYGKLYQAATKTSNNVHVFIMGSQSIWGNLEAPNKELLNSCDLDCLPDYDLMNESGITFNELDSHITFCAGEGTEKVDELYNGKFLDLITDKTVCAPTCWRERVKEKTYELNNGTTITASFLDKHDLILSKMVAGRGKDLDYVKTLFNDNSVSVKEIKRTLNSTEMEEPIIRRISNHKKDILGADNFEVTDKEILKFKQGIADRLNHYIKLSHQNGRNAGQPIKKITIKDECLIDCTGTPEFPKNLNARSDIKPQEKLNMNKRNNFRMGLKNNK